MTYLPPCLDQPNHEVAAGTTFCYRCGLVVAPRQPPRTRPKRQGHSRQIRALLARDGPRCAYCHREFSDELPPTVDHVIPVSRGGSHNRKNLVLACEPCNNDKADRTPWEWAGGWPQDRQGWAG